MENDSLESKSIPLPKELTVKNTSYDSFSLCSFDNRFAFITETIIKAFGDCYNLVYRYDLKTQEWKCMPEYHLVRWIHTSCSTNNSIYIFGQARFMCQSKALKSSIEKLKDPGTENVDNMEPWELIYSIEIA